jgi:hypothetical protein
MIISIYYNFKQKLKVKIKILINDSMKIKISSLIYIYIYIYLSRVQDIPLSNAEVFLDLGHRHPVPEIRRIFVLRELEWLEAKTCFLALRISIFVNCGKEGSEIHN